MYKDLKNNKKRTDRIGEKNTNKQNENMQIIEYNNAQDIRVLFEDGNTRKCTYGCFKKGNVVNLYHPRVCGVGYIGEGEYKSVGKDERAYSIWYSMISRCYNTNENSRSYLYASVCKEWHNFQNFAKWYYDNIYDLNKPLQLDKDILQLYEKQKIYSPQKCLIVPYRINQFFTKFNNLHYTITDNGKYYTYLSYNNKQIYIGTFETIEDSQTKYLIKKYEIYKDLLSEYKDKIPDKTFSILSCINFK